MSKIKLKNINNSIGTQKVNFFLYKKYYSGEGFLFLLDWICNSNGCIFKTHHLTKDTHEVYFKTCFLYNYDTLSIKNLPIFNFLKKKKIITRKFRRNLKVKKKKFFF